MFSSNEVIGGYDILGLRVCKGSGDVGNTRFKRLENDVDDLSDLLGYDALIRITRFLAGGKRATAVSSLKHVYGYEILYRVDKCICDKGWFSTTYEWEKGEEIYELDDTPRNLANAKKAMWDRMLTLGRTHNKP